MLIPWSVINFQKKLIERSNFGCVLKVHESETPSAKTMHKCHQLAKGTYLNVSISPFFLFLHPMTVRNIVIVP